jgi:hypothetical protein
MTTRPRSQDPKPRKDPNPYTIHPDGIICDDPECIKTNCLLSWPIFDTLTGGPIKADAEVPDRADSQ